jgi:hypothetical protein
VTLAALLLAAASWPLTVDGYGPARIGMTQAEVANALHVKLTGEAIDDEDVCVEKEAAGFLGVMFMFEDKKLARVSLWEGSKVRTARGIGLGATADAVRRAYGKALKAERHHYEDLPSEYLTFWTVPKKRGVRFETNSKRRVQAIHAGTDAIQYVEGCA